MSLRDKFDAYWAQHDTQHLLPSSVHVFAWHSYRAAYKVALEDAACVAKAHRAPSATRKRSPFTTDEALQEIRAEERGEEIAASVIGDAIRALAQGLDK